jgi:hypothetical protein
MEYIYILNLELFRLCGIFVFTFLLSIIKSVLFISLSCQKYFLRYLSLVVCVVFVDNYPFNLFSLAITLCVLLRYAASNYHLGIFRLFLHYLKLYTSIQLAVTMRSTFVSGFRQLGVVSVYSGLPPTIKMNATM